MQKTTVQMMKAASFEAAFVVLGVILALAANEWRNNIADKDAAQNAIQSIYRELTDNQKLVEASYAYHQKTAQTLFGLETEADIRLFPKGFVFPARVSSNAWHTASETGALKKVSYDTLLPLTNLYNAQQRYENQSFTVGNIIYERLFEGGSAAITSKPQNLATVILTMSYREKELLALYTEVLAEQPNQAQ